MPKEPVKTSKIPFSSEWSIKVQKISTILNGCLKKTMLWWFTMFTN